MASTANGENVGGDDTVVTNNPTASATAADNADGSGSPTKPKRPRGRGRKGSLMFTPGGSYGLGVTSATPSNIIPPTSTISNNDTVAVTSTNTTTTTNGKDNGDNELLVDFPTADTTASTNNVETVPKHNTEVHPTPTLLSGDHYVSMLLKAEIEGNSRQVADLQRRGSCMVRPGGIGGLGMEGFQDDDDSDDDGLTRRSSQSGSADHRPLVGGFAAAAYEAAREFHYSKKKNEQNNSKNEDSGDVVRNMPPPSI